MGGDSAESPLYLVWNSRLSCFAMSVGTWVDCKLKRKFFVWRVVDGKDCSAIRG